MSFNFNISNRLHDLDSSVTNHLKMETFQGKFVPKDFVENISVNLVAMARNHPQDFDPKPFIRTFEFAVNELVRLKARVENTVDELERNTEDAQQVYKKRLVNLSEVSKDIQHSFTTLESRVSEVGNIAIRIGERLESIDNQRVHASDVKELAELFIQFNKGPPRYLEDLRINSGPDGQFKAATIARRLNGIAKEVDYPGTELAVSNIEKYCETLETNLLEAFDRGYKKGDTRTMANCARTLCEFNGGQSCIQTYINQHEFFISQMKLMEPENALENRYSGSSKNLNDSNPGSLPVDPWLDHLYQEIRQVIREEWEVISIVFPNALSVIQVFIQRIFAQSIQGYLESLLQRAESQSRVAYLRILASSHAATVELVEDLKKFDEFVIQPKVHKSGQKLGTVSSLSVTLDRCMDDLFIPYSENEAYIRIEKRALNDVFKDILAQFTTYHVQRPAFSKSRSVFGRSGSRRSISSGTARLLAKAATSVGNNVQLPPEEDGILSVDSALELLSIHTEAIERCIELSSTEDLPKNVSDLFSILVESLGRNYTEVALDATLDDLQYVDAKNEPDLKWLETLQLASSLIHLIQNHFQTIVMPLLTSSASIYRDAITYKNNFMTSLESKLNGIIQKTIDVIGAWLNTILSRQKKNDFRLRDDDIEFIGMATQPCTQCIDFLKRTCTVANRTLDGHNLEMFLLEVGVNFYGLLLAHFKKFTVNALGGLVVSKDISKYQEAISMYRQKELNDLFEMLHHLGNLFLVRSEILKSLLEEDAFLQDIPLPDLVPYIQMREDYRSSQIPKLLGIYTPQTTTGWSSLDKDIRAMSING
ncbi:exocyst complex component Sec10 [Basidiobolus meristosporus CBS 931.73]|uniref:Exocyst complex component Sec10 n=1 Tax=Basidiobolus meristosporus CBS 931.73 TaxID=1314790 RepID=A0A1Y1YLN3_9FUNG|nr:exocyst complex component Sec10 [Basidiobolus meristosporus CBS 931.73]|eukprot:ORX98920.1 exocyst complex component Sec10 [Basidiobolus meristosporus CBS 931.73]